MRSEPRTARLGHVRAVGAGPADAVVLGPVEVEVGQHDGQQHLQAAGVQGGHEAGGRRLAADGGVRRDRRGGRRQQREHPLGQQRTERRAAGRVGERGAATTGGPGGGAQRGLADVRLAHTSSTGLPWFRPIGP
ncbi:hypothetical protein GCM10025868_15580 [Angustibacter aerolatus]|uniref:Uncharacterized protein n=1 Tax=Angustibacter aerolatus TaxID=1162965 RepID=A0ABQ6JDS6_9ACTN|nr:hypothetical protein GCM10025868_15580 [Angustibacter aerolatus]